MNTRWIEFAAQFSYDTTDVLKPFMLKKSGERIGGFEALQRAFNAGRESKRVEVLNAYLDLKESLEMDCDFKEIDSDD